MNSLGNIIHPITASLHRFHMLIFFVTLVGGLSAAILMLNSVVLRSGKSADSSLNNAKSSFDQATINRIKKLKTSSEPGTPLDFSQGRISPFSE